MYQRIDRALMMNEVQRVSYYRWLWWEHRTDLLFFDSEGIDWDKGKIRGMLLRNGRWTKGLFPFPQTVYNRCYPEPTDDIERLGSMIGKGQIFNDCTHLDKWNVYKYLQASEVGHFLPPTYQYNQDDLLELLQEHSPLILKPRLGHGGAGVFKLTLLSPRVLMFLSQWGIPIPLVGEERFVPLLTQIAPPSSYIAQMYVESMKKDVWKYDVRIVMQKNGKGAWEVGGQLSRVTPASNLLTNHYQAIVEPLTVVSSTLLATLHDLSQVVAETLDGRLATLGEVGVDFLIDEEHIPWILEVNGKPDKGLFWRLGDPDLLRKVYLNPLRYQDYLLRI